MELGKGMEPLPTRTLAARGQGAHNLPAQETECPEALRVFFFPAPRYRCLPLWTHTEDFP